MSKDGHYVYSKPWSDRILLLKLFVTWKRSIWQLIWVDLLIFITMFGSISLLYRNLLYYYPAHKEIFENFVLFVSNIQKMVPLTFILGFFVSTIMGRWWSVMMLLPLMDRCVHHITSFIPSEPRSEEEIKKLNDDVNLDPSDDSTCIHKIPDTRAQKLRFLLIRYLNLAVVMKLQSISLQAQRRFALSSHTVLQQVSYKVLTLSKKLRIYNKSNEEGPSVRQKLEVFNSDKEVKRTLGHLITEEEIQTFERIAEESGSTLNVYDPEYFIPVQWCLRLINEASEKRWIRKNAHTVQLITLLDSFRGRIGTVGTYSGFHFPLAYQQVVLIGIHVYFLCELLGRQFLDISVAPTGRKVDSFLPIFSILKVIFYMGWFKMAHCFVYPLGEAEADCPIAEIFDRNLRISIESGVAKDIIFPHFLQDGGVNKPKEFLTDLMMTYAIKPQSELRQEFKIKNEAEKEKEKVSKT